MSYIVRHGKPYRLQGPMRYNSGDALCVIVRAQGLGFKVHAYGALRQIRGGVEIKQPGLQVLVNKQIKPKGHVGRQVCPYIPL